MDSKDRRSAEIELSPLGEVFEFFRDADLPMADSAVSGSEPLISPLRAATDMLRRVLVDVARAARGAAASSSRGDAFQHLARLGFATRAAGSARDRAGLLPPALGWHVSELATRAITTSAASGAPRSTGSKPKPTASRDSRASKRDAAALEAFVQKCCEDVGRGDDAEAVRLVVGALRDAGRDTMRRLEDFGESDAMAAGVPLRLAVAMRRRIAGQAVARETSRSKEPTRDAAPAAPTPTVDDDEREKNTEPPRREDHFANTVDDETASRARPPTLKSSESDLQKNSRGKMPRSTRPEPARGNVAGTRVTRRLSSPRKAREVGAYRLKPSELSDSLRAEFAKFRRFLTTRRLGSHEAPIKEVTARKYEDQIRGLLGWMLLTFPEEFPEGSDASNVRSMRVAFPSKQKSSARLAFEHLQWLSETRQCGPAYELVALRAFIAAAKFLYGQTEQEIDTDRPYAHVPLVAQLRSLNKDANRRAAKASPTADIRAKWLSWNEYLGLCKTLEDELAPRWHAGGTRTDQAVAWSLQRYLIFGVLSCVPDRQRTIRELEIGRTLFKEYKEEPMTFSVREANGSASSLSPRSGGAVESRATVNRGDSVEILGGRSASGAETWIDLRADATEADYDYRWVIKHGPEDYKTGRNYGERPPMVIAPSLYGAMEEWIEHRRAHLAPRHDYLFTARNGAPLTDVGVHSLLTSTSYRLTGRRVNPHLVRDMIITHLRGTDASERQLEALAIYMGHSLAMQKGTYDRRSKAEKVAPAVELLSSLNGELARG